MIVQNVILQAFGNLLQTSRKNLYTLHRSLLTFADMQFVHIQMRATQFLTVVVVQVVFLSLLCLRIEIILVWIMAFATRRTANILVGLGLMWQLIELRITRMVITSESD